MKNPFTDAIGQDLGIIGADQTIDPTSFKPVLDIQMQAGRPTIVWTKADADSLEVWVDRGDGKGFAFLAVDSQPDYPDTAPLPARPERPLEIQSHLPPRRRAGRPMERRHQHHGCRLRPFTQHMTMNQPRNIPQSFALRIRSWLALLLFFGGTLLGALGFTIARNSESQTQTPAVGMITTFIGGGVGDGLPATEAIAGIVRATAVDAAGNLYMADSAHHRVRKVDAAGVITTIAGQGGGGFAGDGGPATAALLREPHDLAFDAAGNLYIADTGNSRIRKVDGAGIITTVAGIDCGLTKFGTRCYGGDGGPATAAGLHTPFGIAFNSHGDLFIADTYNNRIRKIDNSGIITTVVEPNVGAATNLYPYGIAADPNDNVYIADYYNQVVRKLDTAGTLTTVAGGGEPITGNGDGGAATSAKLNYPTSVATDAAGNWYVAEEFGFTVRKVDPTGTITTAVGNGQFGYSGDGGPASEAPIGVVFGIDTDQTGNLYIGCWGSGGGGSPDLPDYLPGPLHYHLRKVNTSGTITTVVGNGELSFFGDAGPTLGAALAAPWGVPAVDATGNVYIPDTANHRVRKVTTSGVISTVVGTGEPGYSGDDGAATAATILFPTNVAFDPVTGDLYISDSGNNTIRKVDGSGKITSVAGGPSNCPLYPPPADPLDIGSCQTGDGGPATLARLRDPRQITFDASGNLYIADRWHYRVRKVDRSNGIITTVAGSNRKPYGSGDGGPAVQAGLRFPDGVAVDASGNIYIADTFSNRIRKVDLTGTISTIAGQGSEDCDPNDSEACYQGDGGPALTAKLSRPEGLALDAAGNLFIADRANSVIRKIDPSGTITTVAGRHGDCRSEYRVGCYDGDQGAAVQAGLNTPFGVALDTIGNLYISDTFNDRIRKVDFNAALLQPVNVVSRKTHGSAGMFGINLPLTGPPGIECRREQTTGTHHVIFSFATPVTVTGATVTPSGTGQTAEKDGPPVRSGDGKEVTVNLKNVTNAQTITVKLLGVSDGTSTNDISVRMGVLLGDTTGNGVVDSGDITQTRRQSGQVSTESNKRIDLTTDGVINSGDITLVRRQSGTALPTP